MRILVVVGTTPFGWDELVLAADDAARELGLTGVAQIGNGRYVPTNLDSTSFASHSEILDLMGDVDLTVIHGGLGSIGDALRHSRRLVVVPRPRGTGWHGRQAAPNDQWPTAERLASQFGFPCTSPSGLKVAMQQALAHGEREPVLLHNPAESLIKTWLADQGISL